MYKLIVKDMDLKILEMEKPLTERKIKKAMKINENIYNFGDNNNFYAWNKSNLIEYGIDKIKAWMYDNLKKQEELKGQMEYFRHKITKLAELEKK